MFTDDLTGLVFHCGHLNSQIGYIGDEHPLFTARSLTSPSDDPRTPLFFEDIVAERRKHFPVEPLFAEDNIRNVDVFAEFIDRITQKLNCRMHDQPMVLTTQDNEAAWSSERAKLASLLFEKKQSSALFFISKALCSLFATGRLNGLIVDAGAYTTEAAAIYDGYILKRTVRRVAFGGEEVTAQVRRELEARLVERGELPGTGISLRAGASGPFSVLTNQGSATFNSVQIDRTYRLIKEAAVSGAPKEEKDNSEEKYRYELPDGAAIDIKCLVDASKVLFEKKNANPNGLELQTHLLNLLNETHIDCRKALVTNIVLTGGNTLLPRFQKNFETAIGDGASLHVKPKVHAATKPFDRKIAPWLGASIVGSVEAFQNMWISKFEFSENGESAIFRKCLN